MIAIHAEDTRGGLAGALARGGLLVTADELVDIDRLTAWCVALRESEPAPYPVRPHGDRRNRLAQLYADLIAGGPRLAAESTGRAGEPTWRAAVQSIAATTADARDPLDTLTLALATLYGAWDQESAGGTRHRAGARDRRSGASRRRRDDYRASGARRHADAAPWLANPGPRRPGAPDRRGLGARRRPEGGAGVHATARCGGAAARRACSRARDPTGPP